jgi:hypothetical protein
MYPEQLHAPSLRRGGGATTVDRQYGRVHDFAVNEYKSVAANVKEIPRQTTDMVKDVGANTVLYAQKLADEAEEFATDPSNFKTGNMYFEAGQSNMMARIPGFSIGVSAFGGSLIDTTQFSWRFGVRLTLRLLSARTDASLAPVLWQVLSDSTDDFETYLVKPGFRACAGLGVMLGYSNPWARLFREACTSAVATQAAAAATVRVLFVDIPTLSCICRDAEGSNFAEYARAACWEPAPSHMKPVIAMLIAGSGGSRSKQVDVCKQFNAYTSEALRSIMDPVLEHGYAATEAAGSALDYITILIDPEAGNCANLISSPYTMAIVPEPIDYFRACGKTESCRNKCQTVFREFDELNEHLSMSKHTFEFSGTVEKRFFSSADVTQGLSAAPFEILAMMEVPAHEPCTALDPPEPCCASGDVRDRCVLVSGMNSRDTLEVVEYCVPYNVAMGTHERVRWNVSDASIQPSDVRSVHFARRSELLVSTQHTVRLLSWGQDPFLVMEPLDELAVYRKNMGRMHRVSWTFVAPGEFAVISGLVNQPSSYSKQVSVCVSLTGGRRETARACSSNLVLHLSGGHVATCVGAGCVDMIMMPTTSKTAVR